MQRISPLTQTWQNRCRIKMRLHRCSNQDVILILRLHIKGTFWHCSSIHKATLTGLGLWFPSAPSGPANTKYWLPYWTENQWQEKILSPKFFFYIFVGIGECGSIKMLDVLLWNNRAAEAGWLHHYSPCYYNCMESAEILLCTGSAYKVNIWSSSP